MLRIIIRLVPLLPCRLVRSLLTPINNNLNLTKSLQPSSHRRLVGDLSIFCRYFHGHCSQKIRNIIPVPLRRVRTTRSSTHSHPFQVLLPTSQTLSHQSSFIPKTCTLWSVLPSSCFPESFNLPSFKSKINKLDLMFVPSQPFTFFSLPLLGLCIGHHGLFSTLFIRKKSFILFSRLFWAFGNDFELTR